jgi:hypothetical protein
MFNSTALPKVQLEGFGKELSTENFPDWLKWAYNSAIKCGKVVGDGELGLLMLVASPEICAAAGASGDFALIEFPGRDAPPDAEARKIWVKQMPRWESQEMAISTLRELLLSSVDPILARGLENALGLICDVTCMRIVQAVREEFGEFEHADLDSIWALLEVPFDPTAGAGAMRSFIDVHKHSHEIAAAHAQALPEPMKIKLFLKAIEASGVFPGAKAKFNFKFPTFAGRTWAALTTYFKAEDKRRREESTTVDQGYVAAATTVRRTVEVEQQAEIAVLRAENADLRAQLKVAQAALTTKVGGGGPEPTKYTHYCHSHGPNYTHGSQACTSPRVGHQKTATMENKQGGAPKPWSFKKGQGTK